VTTNEDGASWQPHFSSEPNHSILNKSLLWGPNCLVGVDIAQQRETGREKTSRQNASMVSMQWKGRIRGPLSPRQVPATAIPCRAQQRWPGGGDGWWRGGGLGARRAIGHAAGGQEGGGVGDDGVGPGTPQARMGDPPPLGTFDTNLPHPYPTLRVAGCVEKGNPLVGLKKKSGKRQRGRLAILTPPPHSLPGWVRREGGAWAGDGAGRCEGPEGVRLAGAREGRGARPRHRPQERPPAVPQRL